MTLKDYLAKADVDAAALARDAGVSFSTIWRAAEGKTIPNRELMTKIAELTGHEVLPNDFFGLAA